MWDEFDVSHTHSFSLLHNDFKLHTQLAHRWLSFAAIYSPHPLFHGCSAIPFVGWGLVRRATRPILGNWRRRRHHLYWHWASSGYSSSLPYGLRHLYYLANNISWASSTASPAIWWSKYALLCNTPRYNNHSRFVYYTKCHGNWKLERILYVFLSVNSWHLKDITSHLVANSISKRYTKPNTTNKCDVISWHYYDVIGIDLKALSL